MDQDGLRLILIATLFGGGFGLLALCLLARMITIG